MNKNKKLKSGFQKDGSFILDDSSIFNMPTRKDIANHKAMEKKRKIKKR